MSTDRRNAPWIRQWRSLRSRPLVSVDRCAMLASPSWTRNYCLCRWGSPGSSSSAAVVSPEGIGASQPWRLATSSPILGARSPGRASTARGTGFAFGRTAVSSSWAVWIGK